MIDRDRRATIIDVAKLSGVSITTVSRVINDNYPVKEETKVKVNAAIEELKFKPNLLARSLIQDKSQTIGILTPSIENLFFSEVIKGIDMRVKNKNYTTFLCNTEGNPEYEKQMIGSLLDRSVDGIISIDPQTENVQNGFYERISKKIPLVLINGYHKGINCNYVMNDEEIGTIEALRHFKACNHKEIALLRGRRSHSYDVKEKVYKNFMEAEGLFFTEEHVINIKDGNGLETVHQAREAFIASIKKGTKYSAVLCCNDWMAVGVLNGARALGLGVPKDLSIIGFDNTIISQIAEPTLTTVDHNMLRLGQTASERMFEIITNPDQDAKKIIMTTKLIIRNS